MKIGVVGTGYVGLVTGACLAEIGYQVLCQDVNTVKIEALKLGKIPIYEPGLTSLVEQNTANNRLHFTSSITDLVAFAEIIFIAVGTPADENGSADLKHVISVATSIGELMDDYRLIITKSTVPVGTASKVCAIIEQSLEQRKLDIDFDVASNPEFLKEGAAIQDFMSPDRIVIGVDSKRSEQRLRDLYAPFSQDQEKLIVMDIASSEMTKYAANIMLASKISTMNEIANIAELVGADIDHIRIGVGSDKRIGENFIFAGAGYGGSCFPKDVRALEEIAREYGYKAEILQAIESVNKRQKEVLFSKIGNKFGENLTGVTIAIWGLAFKPNTDDMREASSLVLIEKLLSCGANINVYDPVAMTVAQSLLQMHADKIHYCDDMYAVADGADALVLVTEWEQFSEPDFPRLFAEMKQKIIFDGRNIWNPQILNKLGFEYFGIGRQSHNTGSEE